MTSTPSPPGVRPGPGAAALLLRIALSLVGLVALGYWAAISLFLVVFRCGDTCSGDAASYGRWEYVGQFVLVAPMALAGAIGLVLGFTSRRQASVRLLAAAAAGAVTWWIWLSFVSL